MVRCRIHQAQAIRSWRWRVWRAEDCAVEFILVVWRACLGRRSGIELGEKVKVDSITVAVEELQVEWIAGRLQLLKK